MHGELADDRLSRAGGRRDQDAASVLEGVTSRDLEGVEVEALPSAKEAVIGCAWGLRLRVAAGGIRHRSSPSAFSRLARRRSKSTDSPAAAK
jgi:hypothetical protein